MMKSKTSQQNGLDTEGNGAVTGGPNASDITKTSDEQTFSVLAQYTKNLSFENPRAPDALKEQNDSIPSLEIKVNVNTHPLQDPDTHEVILHIEATATRSNSTLFAVELSYGGVFTIKGMSLEYLQPTLLIECPRLLFPFVREIIARTTQDGGYTPLLLPQVDFVDMFRRRVAEVQAAQQHNA